MSKGSYCELLVILIIKPFHLIKFYNYVKISPQNKKHEFFAHVFSLNYNGLADFAVITLQLPLANIVTVINPFKVDLAQIAIGAIDGRFNIGGQVNEI